ncbi:fibronectin type III domain-containing protein [Phycisphaerales bacterium AB-hyl4]|uniref:Fibronectin type III domain-containing protein n=1 Tax=Natronomicrosphaera hydrolytica TaxID=3242702 RepID=A0ABV4U3F8_9BACT
MSLFCAGRVDVILLCLLVSLVGVGGGTSAAAAEADPSPRHVRVLWMEQPQHEAVVSWTTHAPGEAHRLYYDTQPRYGELDDYAYEAGDLESGAYTLRSADRERFGPGYYHHAHLDTLEPDTVYYFVAVTDGEVSEEFHFITAPADDPRRVRIIFGGDSRIAGDEPYVHEDRRNMNRRIARLVEQYPDILAFAHGGDYCQRAEWRYIKPWLDDHELIVTAEGRILPIIPARGNHDRGIVFEEKFHWPGRERDYYYTTQLTGQIALITLNTEISLGGDQRTWLADELSELRPTNRWLFAQYHKPAYSSVRGIPDGESRRRNFVPLFEQYRVDLVCESHDHALKRTVPIRDGQPDFEAGIIYIGDGGLGVPQREPDPSRWWFEEPGFAKPTHHVHMLTFEHDALRVQAFGMDGETLDDFTVEPQVQVTAEASR